MYAIKICHLYPDLLNLSGDRGNIITLVKRMQWRGIEVEVESVGAGQTFDAKAYDIIFMGGEPDQDWTKLLKELAGGNGKAIVDAVEAGKIVLAVNGGFQILGKNYNPVDGKVFDLLGVLDAETKGAKNRRTGDCIFQCSCGTDIVAFENHAGKTYLGEDLKPLGKVISGFGNNGEDGTEGARYKGVFATYGHGPILPKNPKLADAIIMAAMANKYPDYEVDTLEDDFENQAHVYMEQRLKK